MAHTQSPSLTYQFNLFKIRVWRRGRDSNPRWRLAITVFKTVAIDHSATPPDIASGRAGGTRTPNRRFWRPLLYQLSYRPNAPPLNLFESLLDEKAEPGSPPRSSIRFQQVLGDHFAHPAGTNGAAAFTNGKPLAF